MKLLWILLITLPAYAGIQVEGNNILPYSVTDYPLEKFVTEYASVMNKNITYVDGTIRPKDTLSLKVNQKVSKEDFQKIFYNVLVNLGFSTLEFGGAIWIIQGRDVRYRISDVYTEENFPNDSRMYLYMLKLKYPVSSQLSRNTRPYLSRYGRVIDFSDGRNVLIHDTGENIRRILKTVKQLDTEEAYKRMLSYVPKPDPNQGNPLQEKVLELELDKKLLEKKLVELKEGQNQ